MNDTQRYSQVMHVYNLLLMLVDPYLYTHVVDWIHVALLISSRLIFVVSNIAYDVTEQQLIEYFNSVGPVVRFK